MVRLWQYAFTGPASQSLSPMAPLTGERRRWLTLLPIGALVALSLAIGIFSAPVFHWSSIAAQQVLDREGYISAVHPSDEITQVDHK